MSALLTCGSAVWAESFNMPQFGRVEKTVSEEIQFYDLKGTAAINSSSSNNSFATVVFLPQNEGEVVQIRFSDIALKGDGANYPVSLSIFDGNYNEEVSYPTTTSAVTTADFPDNGNLLKRYYSAADKSLITDSEVVFTSSSPDGALSVCFLYKYAGTCDGWTATVKSVPNTPQQLTGIETDYSEVSPSRERGDKDVVFGAAKFFIEGISDPINATAIKFTVTDPDGILENIRLKKGQETVSATPAVEESDGVTTYAYQLSVPMNMGTNTFNVVADIKNDAPFHSEASVTFTELTTDAPSQPEPVWSEPLPVKVAAVIYLESSEGTHDVDLELNLRHKPYSAAYQGYSGATRDYTATFVPTDPTKICRLEFDKINLYFYKSSYGYDVNPVFEVYSGTEVSGEPIYVHTKEMNFSAPENCLIPAILSESADGALTIRFNPGTSNSSTTKESQYGYSAFISQYTPRPMNALNAEAFHTEQTSVSVSDAHDVAILGVRVKTDGNANPPAVTSVGFSLKGDTSAYTSLNLLSSGRKANPEDAQVIGTATANADGGVCFSDLELRLKEGENYLWLSADVSADAAPGTLLDATLDEICVDATPLAIVVSDPEGEITTVNTFTPQTADKTQTVTVGQYPVLVNGLTSDYMASEYTITALPASPDGKVIAKFTEGFFNVNTSYQYLLVKGGVEETKIHHDTQYPVSVKSVREDGSLTIEYHSMSMGDARGWKCELTQHQDLPLTASGAARFGNIRTDATPGSEALADALRLTVTGDQGSLTLNSLEYSVEGDLFENLRLVYTGSNPFYAAENILASADGQTAVFNFAEPLEITRAGEYHFWVVGKVGDNAPIGATASISPVALSYAAGTESLILDLSDIGSTSFTVAEAVEGTITVGNEPGADYATLNEAIASLESLETGLTGPVTIHLQPGTYQELVNIDHLAGLSRVNTLTLEGLGSTPEEVLVSSDLWIEPPYSDDKEKLYYGVITLRGSSFITFRNLSVATSNEYFPSLIRLTDGASDITVENCHFEAPTIPNPLHGLSAINIYNTSDAPAVSNNISISDSEFVGGCSAIKLGSFYNTIPEMSGISICNNRFSKQAFQGVYIMMADEVEILGNTFISSETENVKPYSHVIDLSITGPGRIEGNDIQYAQPGTFGLYLRSLNGSEDNPIVIANNVIDIDCVDESGAGIQIYNNNQAPYTGFVIAHNNVRTTHTPGLALLTVPLMVDVKAGTDVEGSIANNIFMDKLDDYVIREQNGVSGINYSGNMGYSNSLKYAYMGNDLGEINFAQWTSMSGENGAVNRRLEFDDASNYALFPADFATVPQAATLPSVAYDILGNERNGATTAVGAYELPETVGLATLAGSHKDGAVYDLRGMKVSGKTKGIVVADGKLVMRK